MICAEFLSGPAGGIPLVHWQPDGRSHTALAVVICPPLGEEMNKTRHMVAAQARRFAAAGVRVYLPDYFGTGDSAGNLHEARWDTWLKECLLVAERARERGADRVVLFGVRAGCLLAAHATNAASSLFDAIVLWQPVHVGKQFVTQQLRLRVAASSLKGVGSESLDSLRQKVAQGESLEIGGYLWPALLLGEIQARSLAYLETAQLPLAVLEVSQKESPELTPLSRRLVDERGKRGLTTSGRAVGGDSFWATQELSFAEHLIDATAEDVLAMTGADAIGGAEHPGMPPAAACEARAMQEDMRYLRWDCAGSELLGVLHSGLPAARRRHGVIIVVGGPQYRVGSHRQFIYLARLFAQSGYTALRFDYRGMGDADGELKGFLHTKNDISSAIDTLLLEEPALEGVVLWGLCDAATAALRVASGDPRVAATVMVNPWVYSEQGAAQVRLTRYYAEKLFGGEFWKKLFRGDVSLKDSMRDALKTVHRAIGQRGSILAEDPNDEVGGGTDLVALLADAALAVENPVLLVLSGNDLTAAEFEQALARDKSLGAAFGKSNVKRLSMPDCDHTFSTAEWRNSLSDASVAFLHEL